MLEQVYILYYYCISSSKPQNSIGIQRLWPPVHQRVGGSLSSIFFNQHLFRILKVFIAQVYKTTFIQHIKGFHITGLYN